MDNSRESTSNSTATVSQSGKYYDIDDILAEGEVLPVLLF